MADHADKIAASSFLAAVGENVSGLTPAFRRASVVKEALCREKP